MNLEKRNGVALITGASSGIGATDVEALGEHVTRYGLVVVLFWITSDETARPRRSTRSPDAALSAQRGICRD